MKTRPVSDLDRAKIRESRAAAKAEARFARELQSASDLRRAGKSA